jgi:hypothetical protein
VDGAPGRGGFGPSRFVNVMALALSIRSDKQKTLAFPARVPLVVGGFALAAPVPPSSSVLPPGAGNQAKKALQPKKERAKDPEQRRVDQAVITKGQLDVPAIARHDDGDSAAVPTLELAQCALPINATGPDAAVSTQSTCRSDGCATIRTSRHGVARHAVHVARVTNEEGPVAPPVQPVLECSARPYSVGRSAPAVAGERTNRFVDRGGGHGAHVR